MGKETHKKRLYSQVFKLQAVKRVLEDGRGVRETAREFKVNHSMVQRWMRQYIEAGEAGLRSTRAISMQEGEGSAPPKKRPQKPNDKGYIESELPEVVRNELRHLRMENAYLKKVSALVRSRER